MKTLSVKQFCVENNFTQVNPVVRYNTNNYPYLTFINKDNKAENIYFSKKAAELVAEGEILNKEIAKSLVIAYTTNAQGEERVKLSTNSERLEVADLF